MKNFRYLLVGAALLLASTVAGAQGTSIFIPGGDLTGTYNDQVIVPGAVTFAKQALLAADAVPCNNTPSAATTAPCNPLQIANLLGATLAVYAVCDATCSTTIPATAMAVDGVSASSITAGRTILLTGQTISTNNGIYVYGASTWQRAANFVGAIAENCDVNVFVEVGTKYRGHTFSLNTSLSSAGVVIGGSGVIQSWADTWNLPNSSATNYGVVRTTAGTALVSSMTASPTGMGSTSFNGTSSTNDCASFVDAAGSIGDYGDQSQTLFGPCVISDMYGHPYSETYDPAAIALVFPTVSVGTVDAIASDTAATVTGVTVAANTAWTFTFAKSYPTARPPHCSAIANSATAVPYLSVAPTIAKVVFMFSAALTSATVTVLCF
jgi:hypothetical protein